MSKVETQSSRIFAVVETGGKQYQISEGDVVCVEMLPKVEQGGVVTFDKVLLVETGKNTSVGSPYLEGVTITGELVEHGKGKKLDIVRFRSKSNYHRSMGHRQPYSKVRIGKIG